MDGNGRWAQEKGQDRLYGHFHGVESVLLIMEGCAELGVDYPYTIRVFCRELGPPGKWISLASLNCW